MMRKALLALVLGAMGLPAAAAEAGETPCTAFHCYSTQSVRAEHYGSIAAMDMISARLPEQRIYSFVTVEHWTAFPCVINGQVWWNQCWIETGTMVEAPPNTPTDPNRPLHMFYAERTPAGEFFVKVDWRTVSRGQYVYTMMYDGRRDGCWQIYWWYGPPPNGWKIRAGEYCGWPAVSGEEVAGAEMEGFPQPQANGRSEVANVEYLQGTMLQEGEWLAWPSGTPYVSGNMSQRANPDLSAPGDIEWDTPGIAASAPMQSAEVTLAAPAAPGKTVFSQAAPGRTVKAKLSLRLPGAAAPAGVYKATIKNSMHGIEAEYVGPRPVSEAEVRAGGSR